MYPIMIFIRWTIIISVLVVLFGVNPFLGILFLLFILF